METLESEAPDTSTAVVVTVVDGAETQEQLEAANHHWSHHQK